MRHFPPAALIFIAALFAPVAFANDPHLGNGIKSGEATSSSITVWTRLTAAPDISSDGVAWPMIKPTRDGDHWTFPGPQIPEGHKLEEMAYTLPGAPGEVRISYWPESTSNMSSTTEWAAVDPAADFTHQFKLEKLQPDTRYRCVVESRGAGASEPGQRVQGRFRTAPEVSAASAITFTAGACQEFWRRDDEQNGHKIYDHMRKLDPHFFVHTGDIVYYDYAGPWVVEAALARLKWNQMYALPFQRAFHNEVSSYFLRDDHDTWQDDCWPSLRNNKMGAFTYAEGVDIFFEQVPAPNRVEPWRTVRWGKDLQIWLVEGRDFRSPNTDPDGPDKTIWGAEQKAWFKKSVEESDATFRILVTPTPMVGPDRSNKRDNHANAVFKHEGDVLRRFMAEQKNMIAICGDRHWQYVSIDHETGLREYGTGAASNEHAGGFTMEQREAMHQYLAIIGGFLSCTVTREAGNPILLLRHYDVEGNVVNEDRLTPETIIARP